MSNKCLPIILSVLITTSLFLNGCSFSGDITSKSKSSVSQNESSEKPSEEETIKENAPKISTESVTSITESATEIVTESIIELTTENTTEYENNTSDIQEETRQDTSIDTEELSYIENGRWVIYSPQSSVFDVYKFKAGVAYCEQYDFNNQTVRLYSMDDYTYQEEDNGVIIYRENLQTKWEYADNGEDYMTYSYEETDDPQAGEKGTFKVFHMNEIPDYQTACEQSRNKYITEPYNSLTENI